MGTQAGRAVPAQWNRGGSDRRNRHAGAAGFRLVLARRSVVTAVQPAGHHLLRSASVKLGSGPDNPGGRRTAHLPHGIDRSRLRVDLRANPTQTPAGPIGYPGGSDLARIGGHLALAEDKPSGSAVFGPAGHADLARPVRGLSGIYGADVSIGAPGKEFRTAPHCGGRRSGAGVRWGKMTDYTAQVGTTQVYETRTCGRTSKTKRRVERNPV